MKKGIFVSLVFALIIVGCVNSGSNLDTKVINNNNSSYIFVIYSSSCPHCHALINYLDSLKANVSIVKIERNSDVYSILKSLGIKWNGGVPFMVVHINNSFVTVEGFPSDSQNINGYFYGKNEEENLCKKWGGTGVYKNGEYLYCRLSDGSLVGNEYSLKYLIQLCEINKCRDIGLRP